MYEDRLKAIRDQLMWEHAAEDARKTVLREGRAGGILVGRVTALQEMLGHQPTPAADLEAISLADLQALAAELQKKLRG